MDEEDVLKKNRARRERGLALESSVNDILEDSIAYNDVVNRLIREYTEELDSFSVSMDKLSKDIRAGTISHYTDLQLEMRTVVLAHALHKASEGLGVLGGQSDVARMTRETKFAEIYKKIPGGTIPDKKAKAEEFVMTEKQVEALFQRAYQTLSSKIKSGNRVLEALKKVLTSRNIMKEVFRKEYHDNLDKEEWALPDELDDDKDSEMDPDDI